MKELLEIPEGLEPFVNDYRLHVFEVAWLSDEQISRMSSDFQVVARFFRDKRLGTDSVSKDETRIRHADEDWGRTASPKIRLQVLIIAQFI